MAADRPPPSSSALGACALDAFDLNRVNMAPEEGKAIYDAEVSRLAIKFGWQLPIEKGRRSHADHHVARGLGLVWHFGPEEVAAVLMYGSEKAAERGMDYILRTVNAARCARCARLSEVCDAGRGMSDAKP